MMMRHGAVRAEIMALPPEDRLPWAIDRLEEILGDADPQLGVLIASGIRPSGARLVIVLSAAAPRWLETRTLAETVSAAEFPSAATVSVAIHHLRKARVPVETRRGYCRLAEPFTVDLPAPVALSRSGRMAGPRPQALPCRGGAEWTKAEDGELRAMVTGGWCVAAMADELMRSERAVNDRLRVLGLRS